MFTCALLILLDKNLKYVILAGVLLLGIALFVIPVKNFAQQYLNYCPNYEKVNLPLIEWKNENQENLDEIIMVDISSAYYLMLDTKPSYQYFSKQSDTCMYALEIADGISDYIYQGNTPLAFMGNNGGWFYLEIGEYVWMGTLEVQDSIATYELHAHE